MLEIKKLGLITEELLLEPFDLTLFPGTIYGLTAENGAGKSTLLRTISGLRKEQQGSILIKAENGAALTAVEVKKSLFYFENSFWLDENLTGLDYLTIYNKLWQGEPRLVQEMISFWDLAPFIKKPLKKYSLGMKQKILLSLYGVSDARYWLLDEPTLALDKKSVALLADFFIAAKNKKKLILFSSHGGDEIFKTCKHVFSIENCLIWKDGERI